MPIDRKIIQQILEKSKSENLDFYQNRISKGEDLDKEADYVKDFYKRELDSRTNAGATYQKLADHPEIFWLTFVLIVAYFAFSLFIEYSAANYNREVELKKQNIELCTTEHEISITKECKEFLLVALKEAEVQEYSRVLAVVFTYLSFLIFALISLAISITFLLSIIILIIDLGKRIRNNSE